MKKLSNEFIEKYKNAKNPMSPLGRFVYLRTYARFLPEKGRREHWYETVRRVVEHQSFLDPDITIDEMEDLYESLYSLDVFASGRTMWTGGTELSREIAMQNYNCSFVNMNKLENLKDIMYLGLIGTGVGTKLQKKDIEKLPNLRLDFEVNFIEPDNPKKRGKEFTSLVFDEDNNAKIIVGDSKEGWSEAIDLFIKFHYYYAYRNVEKLTLDFTEVRASGTRLKSFGGTASGHQPLKQTFVKWRNIFKKANKDNKNRAILEPIDLLDMITTMAQSIVVGGVRRIAIMILFDEDDNEIFHAKDNMYYQDGNGEFKMNKGLAHRQLSNNSVIYHSKPTRDELHSHIERVKNMGSPGFINEAAAKERREDFEGVNPYTILHADLKVG